MRKCRSMPELHGLNNTTYSILSPTPRSKTKGQKRVASLPSSSSSDRIDRIHVNPDEDDERWDDGEDQQRKKAMLSRIEHISALLALCMHVECMTTPCGSYVPLSRSVECSTSFPTNKTNKQTRLESFVVEQVALCVAAPPDVHDTTTTETENHDHVVSRSREEKSKSRVYPVGQRRTILSSPKRQGIASRYHDMLFRFPSTSVTHHPRDKQNQNQDEDP